MHAGAGDLNDFLAAHDMETSNGYGVFKGKAFRIAHMGEVNDADLDRLFSAIASYLERTS